MSDPAAPRSTPGDDRTVVASSSAAGALPSGDTPLPVGHVLQEYVIEGLIGEGGFGIVYLARDTQLGRVVALKEYMPSSLATRAHGSQVTVRSERQRETFELGRRSFVNEAQLLAAFDHPSLVKVYRFWEQNGTAYMVMPFYQGPTLRQWLVEHGSPSEPWLLSLLAPLVDALEVLHHNRCFHRDIAPDNILLLQPSATQLGQSNAVRPMLLDFGAARRVISDATQALTVILKPGYAPIEQYAESSSMKQGAWTDVYALCAVLYAAVSGRAPLPSVSRIVDDEMVPAAVVGAGRYSAAFLAIIDAGLSIRPEQRPQDMAALRALIASVAPPPPERPAQDLREPSTPSRTALTPPPAATALVPDKPPVVAPSAPPPASKAPLIAGAAFALLLATGVAWWVLGNQPAAPLPPPAAALPPVAAPAPVAAPLPPVAAPAPVAAPLPPPEPFTVVAGLQDIVRHADPLLGVNVLADKSALRIGADRLQFRVKSKEAGHVYVFLSGTDKNHFYLLFPNEIDKNNRIEANTELVLPRKSWAITAGGPPGTNHIVTVVSRFPRDLGGVGLRAAGEEIPEFDLAQAGRLWNERTAGSSPFVGRAVCPPGPACDAGYGASLLEVEEVPLNR